MPSGRTHDRITLWSLPWVVGVTFLLTRSGELTLMVAGTFLFSGLMFGPDLDIYSQQFQRWGKLRWIWIPYQKMLPHRSSLVAIVAIFGVAVAQLIWGFPWNWQQFAIAVGKWLSIYREEAIALFTGLELGAMTHSWSDWSHSAYKRSQKKRSKRLSSKRGKQGRTKQRSRGAEGQRRS
ncbi:MAG: metal-binding protein [Cyanobacteria bacterium QH_3_48_40]|nr:MAG: metal-binding protein [Cyanobacteria bacterium QH_3_48_40]